MSSTWTILDANGVEKSVADWGLAEVVRDRLNQAPDVVTFRAEGRPSDADPIFAFGSTVKFFRNGTPWFYGRVIQVPGRASGKFEEQLYRVAGPWWYLENLVFQQEWQTTNGTDTTLIATNKSRLILGQKSDGTKLATGAAIAEVLAYATARGVPITVGTITPNAIAPYAEALDRSCAEVIRNLLRWTPDAMTAFDYTATPYPVLSIRLRADATSVTLPAYGAPVSGLELTPRHDLQVPAVVLKFEQTNDIDNDTFTSLIVQAAPSTATGDEFGALVMTLDLAGARATYQKQPVRTAPIPQSDSATDVIAWWKGKFPWLNDFDDTDLMIVAGTQVVAIQHPEDYPDLTESEVPNELQSGSVASWMNLNAAPLTVTATMKYTGTATDASSAVFDANNQRILYTRVTGTNAETQTYSRLTSATDAEPVPEGFGAGAFGCGGRPAVRRGDRVDRSGMYGHDRAGGVAEPDRRTRGVGDDGRADSARGGEAGPRIDADHGGAGEASRTGGNHAMVARQPEPAPVIPPERTHDRLGFGQRGQGPGRRAHAEFGLGLPAVGGRRAGNKPAVPTARRVRYQWPESGGKRKFVFAAIAHAE